MFSCRPPAVRAESCPDRPAPADGLSRRCPAVPGAGHTRRQAGSAPLRCGRNPPPELCHGAPIAHGHLGAAACRVVPLPDGHRVVKPLPQAAKFRLPGHPAGPSQSGPGAGCPTSRPGRTGPPGGCGRRAEAVRCRTGRRSGAAAGAAPIFGGDLPHQRTPQVGKADEAFSRWASPSRWRTAWSRGSTAASLRRRSREGPSL